MRIVSLLPSLTEIVFELGRGDELVGVSHECDYPMDVVGLPRLTRSLISPGSSSASIDAQVAALGGALYELDIPVLAALRPDLILTQAQCDVCGVAEATVRTAAERLACPPCVESVNPLDLAGIYAMFRRLGDLLDARDRAESWISRFEALALEIGQRRQGLPPIRVALLEWTDPIYGSGHWNPDLMALAGGHEVLGMGGQRARRFEWSELLQADPEALLIAPCGYTLEDATREWASLRERDGWDNLSAVRRGLVSLVDGSSYFSRPGPRLLESLAIASAAIDPDRCSDLAPRDGWKRLHLTT